jgi:hypothetical protein
MKHQYASTFMPHFFIFMRYNLNVIWLNSTQIQTAARNFQVCLRFRPQHEKIKTKFQLFWLTHGKISEENKFGELHSSEGRTNSREFPCENSTYCLKHFTKCMTNSPSAPKNVYFSRTRINIVCVMIDVTQYWLENVLWQSGERKHLADIAFTCCHACHRVFKIIFCLSHRFSPSSHIINGHPFIEMLFDGCQRGLVSIAQWGFGAIALLPFDLIALFQGERGIIASSDTGESERLQGWLVEEGEVWSCGMVSRWQLLGGIIA